MKRNSGNAPPFIHWTLTLAFLFAAILQTVRLSDVKDRAEAWAQAFSKCQGL